MHIWDGEINPINEETTHIVINHFIVIGQAKKTARESIPGIIGANDIMIYRPLLRAAEDAAYALNCFTDTPM